MSGRNKSKPERISIELPDWHTFSTSLANYGIGISDIPADVVEYLAKSAAGLGGWLNNTSPKTMSDKYRHIEKSSRNLSPVNLINPEYYNWVKSQPHANNMSSAGQIAFGLTAGARAAIPGVSLVKAVPPRNTWEEFTNAVKRWGVPAMAVPVGMRTLGETVIEPEIDSWGEANP
jgi:hypothetical protein